MKIILSALWLACIAAYLLPETQWSPMGRRILVALLIVHAIEAAAFLPRLRAAGGSLANHVAQTLLFGFIHLRTLPRVE